MFLRTMAGLILSAMFALSCGGDTPPDTDTTTTALTGRDYDAWAEYDADGVEIESGVQYYDSILDPSQNPRIRTLSSQGPSLHSKLEAVLQTASDDESLDVVLAVHSNHRLSKLPRFDPARDRDDVYNQEILTQRQLLQEADDQLRAQERAPVIAAIRLLGGEVTEEFRAGNALAATMSAGSLRWLLSSRSDIVAASPAVSGEKPASYQVDDGIDRQNSDWYVSWGYDGNGYRIGLLDTGVYASHNVFNDPDPINIWRDCAYTVYSNCTQYPVSPWNYLWNPNDTRGSGGHGTFMANVLVGNDNIGSAYEGVAPEADVDSTNVYTGGDHSSLYTTAVLRAFNLLDAYDDVIVANIAAGENPNGTIALAADDLYDEGIIVVAPVGPDDTADAYSPANAHKVLGIGAYYASNGNDWNLNDKGTTDSRFKPDVTAPTKVYGAANTGVSATVEHAGTCPAAAFAGGAATVLRDYYDHQGWSSNPGAIYSAMITFGDEGGSSLDNYDGAGNLELGELSSSTWISGTKSLSSNQTQTVSFYAGNSHCDLRSGIWWAEDYSDSHFKVELRLKKSSTVYASSTHAYSVFQKVMHTLKMSSGWWTLELKSPYGNPVRTTTVYYLIHLRTNCIW